MKVPSAAARTPSTPTTETAPAADAGKTAVPSKDEVVNAVADVATQAATEVANDAFEQAASSSKGIDVPLGDTGATFQTAAPTMKVNPATGKLFAVKAQAEHDASVTSADKKTTVALHTEAAATGSPEGIEDIEASSTLEVNHNRQSGNTNLLVRADTTGQLQSKFHADFASKDGRSTGVVDAQGDKNGGRVDAEAHYRSDNATVDVETTLRSDKTGDLDVHAEGQNKDGSLRGAIDVVADETGVAVAAEGGIDGENVDVKAKFIADSHDKSWAGEVAAEGNQWAASAAVAHDAAGTRGELEASVDTKNVDADMQVAFDKESVSGDAALAVTSDDGKTGIRGEVEGRASRDQSFETHLRTEAEAFIQLGLVGAGVGVEGGTNTPLTATGRLGVTNKRGNVGVNATVSKSAAETKVGGELRVGF